MSGFGSRGGRGGLFSKGPGGRPSNAAKMAKTAAYDPTQTRMSFSVSLGAGGGALKMQGVLALTAPPAVPIFGTRAPNMAAGAGHKDDADEEEQEEEEEEEEEEEKGAPVASGGAGGRIAFGI